MASLASVNSASKLLRAHVDRNQRMFAGVIMIEPAGKPVAFVDGQIELERVAGACRWIWSGGIVDRYAGVAEVGLGWSSATPRAPCCRETAKARRA